MASAAKWKLHPLGYSQFLTMFADEIPPNGKNWPTIGFTLKSDGIWVTPDELFLPTNQELADWNTHPDNDLSKPALSFPCNYNQAHRFFNWLKHHFKTFEISGLEEDWKKEYEESLSWQEEKSEPTSLTTSPLNKINSSRTRTDNLTAILYPVLEEMHKNGETISPPNVMQKLSKHPDLDTHGSNENILWITDEGALKILKMPALRERIKKWKNFKGI